MSLVDLALMTLFGVAVIFFAVSLVVGAVDIGIRIWRSLR